MTWIIHRADRERIFNSYFFSCILLKERNIVLSCDEVESCLHFETEHQAKKAFSYLMEAIKRGDRLVNL